MTKFRVFNHLFIRCVDCNKLTEIMPGDYTEIVSSCDCNKPKQKRTRKTNVKSKKISKD